MTLSIIQNCKIHKFIDFILITILIIWTANAASFISKTFLLICFIFSICIFFARKRKFDQFIFFVLGIWIVINYFSYLSNSIDYFNFNTFIRVTMQIILPYFIIKDIGGLFFDKFFKYAYKLVLISFPIYLIESLYPTFISSIATYLNFFTQKIQVLNGGFYLFIYMHSGWAENIGFFVRNCGFMWEPGGYAFVIIFLLSYRIYISEYNLDIKSFILIITLLSTFSTSGYLALFIIILVYLFKNPKLVKKHYPFIPILLFIFITSCFLFYQKNDFMKGKIDSYLERGTESGIEEFDGNSRLRVTRLGYAIMCIDNAIMHHPFGDGIIYSDYFVNKNGKAIGSSSLSEILRSWGIIGIITLAVGLFNINTRKEKAGIIVLLPMLIMMFSNSPSTMNITYSIVFFSYVNRNKRLLMLTEYLKNKVDIKKIILNNKF